MSELDDANVDQPSAPLLAIEPFTVLRALWRRRLALALIPVVAACLGVAAALVFGTNTHEASTVLMYDPPAESSIFASGQHGREQATQVRLIETRAVAEQVQEQLGLEDPDLDCSAVIERDTDLASISCRAGTAQLAAALANTLRDVFLDHQRSMRRAQLAQHVQDLENRLASVGAQLRSADDARQRFLNDHRDLNLEQEFVANVKDLTATEELYRQAQADLSTNEMQRTNVAALIDAQTKEMKSHDGRAVSATEMSARIQKIHQAIEEDQSYRRNTAALNEAEIALRRMEAVEEVGGVSQVDLERARSRYVLAKALVEDSEQVAAWKAEAKKLEDQLALLSGSPTIERLQERRLNLQLEEVELRSRVLFLEGTLGRGRTNLDVEPSVRREYEELRRETEMRQEETASLEAALAVARREHDAPGSSWTLVSEARVPRFPTSGNRKLIALGLAFVGTSLGWLVLAGMVVLDPRIRSASELTVKLLLPVIGVTPRLSEGERLFPGAIESALRERFNKMAKRLRHAVPRPGARLLVVGAQPGEGTTSVALNLAACWGRQDERVALVDAHVRPGCVQEEIRAVMAADIESVKGLAEYLSSEVSDVDQILWPTVLPRVEVLPRVGEAAVAELLWSDRMKGLLNELSERFGIVVIDAPAVLPHVDAEALAGFVDGVAFVVRSQSLAASVLRDAIERLQAYDVPILGAILTDVETHFLAEKGLKAEDKRTARPGPPGEGPVSARPRPVPVPRRTAAGGARGLGGDDG